MGSSILQYLKTVQSGLYLIEDFEDPNWLADNAWNVLNGTPTVSTANSYLGTQSLILDSSAPLIDQVDTLNTLTMPNQTMLFSTRFYDDLSSVAAGIGYTDENGVERALTSEDATYYCVRDGGNLNVQTVARSVGWHKLEIAAGYSFTHYYLDGVELTTGSPWPSTRQVVNPWAGVRAGGSYGSGQCFMDHIQMYLGNILQLESLPNLKTGTTPGVHAYAADGSALPVLFSDIHPYILIDEGPTQVQINLDLDGDGVEDFHGQLVPYYPGDQVLFNRVDFGRRVSANSPKTTPNLITKESPSGQQETLVWNVRDVSTVTVPALLDDVRLKLLQWWYYAFAGGVYSVALNSERIFRGYISGHPVGYGANTGAYLNQVVIHAPGADGYIKPGMKLRLRYGNDEQLVRVKAVESFGTNRDEALVTFTEYLEAVFPVGPQGAQVLSEFYWPAVYNIDTSLGLTQVNLNPRRWDFSHNFKEALDLLQVM